MKMEKKGDLWTEVNEIPSAMCTKDYLLITYHKFIKKSVLEGMPMEKVKKLTDLKTKKLKAKKGGRIKR